MSVKISFVIKNPGSSDLQPVYVKVKRGDKMEEREAGVIVQIVDGKIKDNSVFQQKLKSIRMELLSKGDH